MATRFYDNVNDNDKVVNERNGSYGIALDDKVFEIAGILLAIFDKVGNEARDLCPSLVSVCVRIGSGIFVEVVRGDGGGPEEGFQGTGRVVFQIANSRGDLDAVS